MPVYYFKKMLLLVGIIFIAKKTKKTENFIRLFGFKMFYAYAQ